MRDFDAADLFHPFFAGFLFFQQFALAGNVAAVAFGEYVFAQGFHGGAGDDLVANRRLDGDFKHLPWDEVAHALDEVAAARLGVFAVDDDGEGIDFVAVNEDVQADEVGGLKAAKFVVKGGKAARHGFEAVEEI